MGNSVLDSDSILRSLDRIIRMFGEANEGNEWRYSSEVDKILDRVYKYGVELSENWVKQVADKS